MLLCLLLLLSSAKNGIKKKKRDLEDFIHGGDNMLSLLEAPQRSGSSNRTSCDVPVSSQSGALAAVRSVRNEAIVVRVEAERNTMKRSWKSNLVLQR
jgi:hypothetical protein